MEEHTPDHGEPVTRAVRQRLQLAESGDWGQLLRDLIKQQDKQAASSAAEANWAAGARSTATDAEGARIAWARRVVSKVRGGCLRAASQVALGDAHAPRTEATVAAIRELTAIDPAPGEEAQLQSLTAHILRDTPLGKRPGRRVIRARARDLKPGAEPGPSGWRNPLMRSLALRADATPLVTRWCSVWARGVTAVWNPTRGSLCSSRANGTKVN